MFNKQIYENSRPGGIGLLEIVGEADQEARLFVPLKRSELRGRIGGPLATLHLTQTYRYSRAQCDKVIEAVYRFPLPGDAAVNGVRVQFGDVEIVTQLEERERAESAYKEALKEGKQAALLTRESPDVFTIRVAGIEPDQDVVVETSYLQLARPQGEEARWTLRVPLTTAPRYVREDEAGSSHAAGQPLMLLRDPGHRFSLDLLIQDAGQISSPTHDLDVQPQENGHDQNVRLRDGEVLPDRDLILTWTPRQDPARPSLSVILHQDAEKVTFLALVAPPATHERGSGIGREVILLVDHSGSMSGPKWEASDWAVNSFLSDLADRDQFALGLFHSTTKWFKSQPCQATAGQVASAARYLDENRDSGGTNLGVALEQALRLKRMDKEQRGRHVLIVTDAQVSDAGRILRLADEEAERSTRRRISVLCIDAAPNAFLAHELAERGGGMARFLTSSPDEQDITTALEDVLADWAEPVLVGLKLQVNCAGGQAAGRETRTQGNNTLIDLGDLPHGRAIWVVGQVPAQPGDDLQFRVTAGDNEIASYRSDSSQERPDLPALKALFGARRILGLEYLAHARYQGDKLTDQLERLGYDRAEIQADVQSAVYAENVYQSTRKALRGLLVRESLAYGLVCAETAFVAVRSEPGKPVEKRIAVGNALPDGWSDQFALRSSAPLTRSGAAAPMQLSAAMPRSGFASKVHRIRDRKAPGRTRKSAVKEVATTVFAGIPQFVQGQAVLLDSTQDDRIPDQATISRIEIELKPKQQTIDRDLTLLLFVGDMAQARARIRLADLVRLGGGRPLNLRKRSGEVVQIVLLDPNSVWATATPKLTVRLTM